MANERCKDNSLDSFFGSFLYDHKVPHNHFLKKLNEIVDWSRFTKRLLRYYEGKGQVGQSPYNPALILKMLLLSYLYNISEREVEVLANDSLSVAYFLGIGADEKAPDHSTLTVFKNRLMERGGKAAYEELFNEIIAIALERGVKFGRLQVVDSVHTIANVNIGKDRARQEKGKAPRDTDAVWGAKGKKIEEGKEGPGEKTKYFYGYKDQVSLNAETEMVTSISPGRADEYDGHQFKRLIEKDMAKGINPEVVTADKGYDDGENHYYLETKGICSAIKLNQRRLQKKNPNKEIWLRIVQSQEYREGLEQRYKIERKFGEAKKWHGFGCCRYVGYLRHTIQTYLTFMVLNLKRLVKLLTGHGFKSEYSVKLMSC